MVTRMKQYLTIGLTKCNFTENFHITQSNEAKWAFLTLSTMSIVILSQSFYPPFKKFHYLKIK